MVRWSAVTMLGILLIIGGYNFDVEQAFTYYGGKISPGNPIIGVWIFLAIMSLVIFSDEIFSFFKKGKGKINLRKKF